MHGGNLNRLNEEYNDKKLIKQADVDKKKIRTSKVSWH
jgi:hypothetical protein